MISNPVGSTTYRVCGHDSMIERMLSIIDSNFPIFLEESADVAGEILLDDLFAKVSDGNNQLEVTVTIQLLDRIFVALCLTHSSAQKAGKWRFRSYPAWLLARSILNILKTKDQTLFDPGYWSSNCPDSVIDEQRRILGFIENNRQQFHPEHCASAIRFVYVAWAVIFLDGKILMYHREDKSRKEAAGNFGLPGGRFRIDDAPSSFHGDKEIREFATGKSHWPLQFLDKTLVREIEEELELHQGDYAYTPLADLAPYVKVEGGKNNHALTEYRMRLYSIQLNQRGLVRLFDSISQLPSDFSWFSESELITGINSSGDTAFVDAIAEHKILHPNLTLAGESFKDAFLKPEKAGSGITIPLTKGQPILDGKSGKPLTKIHAELTEDEHDWLWALACHAKGLPFEKAASNSLLRYGWVKLNKNDVTTITRLKEKLELKGLTLIEIIDGRYARLSTTPSAIYFDDNSFRYSIGSDKTDEYFIEIKLVPLNTAIGKTKAQMRNSRVPWSVYKSFMDAASSKTSEDPPPEETKRMINEGIGAIQKELGLRMLINNKLWSFNIAKETQADISGSALEEVTCLRVSTDEIQSTELDSR